MERRKSHAISVGSINIGGDAPISIQSMTNTDTADANASIAQIQMLANAGCEIARVSVPNEQSAVALKEICAKTTIPIVADIHFDYRLAIAAIENGIDKLRINPGNIGSKGKVKLVVDAAKANNVPIRIGVNAGSLAKEMIAKHGGKNKHAMVESAMEHIKILEDAHFFDIIVSLKASDVVRTVEANRILSQIIDYPIHIGVTEAGLGSSALIKAAAGVSSLLLDGIGDTVRVSITGDPIDEISAAKEILSAIGLRKNGIEIISCPTCARTGGEDLAAIVNEVKERLPQTNQCIKIAVMGCIVNGPGEASDADLGLAFALDKCMVFSNGNKIKTIKREDAIETLLALVEEKISIK